ncbi:MAG: hypothetical protein QOE31_3431 [Solirubrobacteraceae bacterium]|nr:hypothetical protein [Solirubrobacteraceae bacterium]
MALRTRLATRVPWVEWMCSGVRYASPGEAHCSLPTNREPARVGRTARPLEMVASLVVRPGGCGRGFSAQNCHKPRVRCNAAHATIGACGSRRRSAANTAVFLRLEACNLGVYAVGHRLTSARSWWMAGVLASGPDAQLSHRSCAALTNVRRTSITYVEVTVPQRRGSVDGVRTYVSARLQPQDCDEIDDIPCTSLARTLLDLAAILPRREVERACDEAEVQRLFDLRALEDVLVGRPGTLCLKRRDAGAARQGRRIEGGPLGHRDPRTPPGGDRRPAFQVQRLWTAH